VGRFVGGAFCPRDGVRFCVFVDAVASDAPGVVAGFLAGARFEAFVIDGVRGFSLACSVWSNFVIRIAPGFGPIVFRG
jgi:hypothetical protein